MTTNIDMATEAAPVPLRSAAAEALVAGARAMTAGLRMALTDVLEQLTNEVRSNGSQLGVLRERESAMRQELSSVTRQRDEAVSRLRDTSAQLAEALDKVRGLLNQNYALREQLAPDPSTVDGADDEPELLQPVAIAPAGQSTP